MDQSIEGDKVQSWEPDLEASFVPFVCWWSIVFQERQILLFLAKKNQHLSYFPVSYWSSCVCPHTAILAHLCCWFVTRHDTPARSRGGSLKQKQEGASVTLVDSVFLVGYWKFTNGTVTFQPLTNAKNGVHHRGRSTLLSQKQLSFTNQTSTQSGKSAIWLVVNPGLIALYTFPKAERPTEESKTPIKIKGR